MGWTKLWLECWRRDNRQDRKINALTKRMNTQEREMADLKDSVTRVQEAESALEGRVTAHEEHAAQVEADLRAEVEKLKAGEISTADSASNLLALADRMKNFDPDALAANNPDGTPPAQGQLPSDQGGTAPTTPGSP